MKHRVPKEVIDKTTKCSWQFSCLETGKCGDKNSLCDVEHVDGKDVLFLKWNKKLAEDCPYHLSFGAGKVCTCPVNYDREKRKQKE